MSEFKELGLQSTGSGKNHWQASGLGAWVYISDGWVGDDFQFRVSKSKSDNPFMIRLHKDNVQGFIHFLESLQEKIAKGEEAVEQGDKVPF